MKVDAVRTGSVETDGMDVVADQPMRDRVVRTVAAIAVAGACAAADAVHLAGRLPAGQVTIWLVFGAVIVAITRLPKATLGAVLLGATIVQVPGLLTSPQSSTDAYRYVWDGRVQLAGHSPYTTAPLDDRLAGLRDPVLFPGLTPQDRTGVHDLSTDSTDDPRTRINRPHVPTIYPPVAQLWFAGIAAVTPWDWGTAGVQLAAALAAIAATALLATRLRKPQHALVFGLSPAVALEAGNNGHIDILAALLILAAVVTVHRRILSGVLLGLAVGVKIVPLLLLPAMRGWLATAATVAAAYLPYALAAGWLVLGYLPGYLGEEGFDDGGGRYALLALFIPDPARAPAAVALGIILAAIAFKTRASTQRTVTWLFGAALLIGTPTYPWYTLPLLGLAVLAGRWEWLAVVVAAYGGYASIGDPSRVGLWYAAALVTVLAATVVRRRGRGPGTRAPAGSGRPEPAPPRRIPRRSPLRPQAPAPR